MRCAGQVGDLDVAVFEAVASETGRGDVADVGRIDSGFLARLLQGSLGDGFKIRLAADEPATDDAALVVEDDRFRRPAAEVDSGYVQHGGALRGAVSSRMMGMVGRLANAGRRRDEVSVGGAGAGSYPSLTRRAGGGVMSAGWYPSLTRRAEGGVLGAGSYPSLTRRAGGGVMSAGWYPSLTRRAGGGVMGDGKYPSLTRRAGGGG